MKQFDNLVIFSLKSIPLQRSAIKLDTQLQWNKGVGTLSRKTQSWVENDVHKQTNEETEGNQTRKKCVNNSFNQGSFFHEYLALSARQQCVKINVKKPKSRPHSSFPNYL